MPRAAVTLGWEFVAADIEKGAIGVACAATEDFTDQMGDVLGGFFAAMLYDTLGLALIATLEPNQFISTIELKGSFLQPVLSGRIVGKGRVVHRDGDVAFLEGLLENPDEATVATDTATRVIVKNLPTVRQAVHGRKLR